MNPRGCRTNFNGSVSAVGSFSTKKGHAGQKPGTTMRVQMTSFRRRRLASQDIVTGFWIPLRPDAVHPLTLAATVGDWASGSSIPFSIESCQIHPLVKSSDLFFIAIEHERFLPPAQRAAFADYTFTGLRPARVIHLRVHVGVEPIFIRGHDLPGVARLLRDEVDLHNRFAAFETIFPRHDQS